MIDLDKLETIAKAATSGPWEQYACYDIVDNKGLIIAQGVPKGRCEDFTYIAAVNPAAILELIAELHKKTALLSEVYDNCGEKVDGACPVCMTYSHKHWCFYPALAKMLGKPLDEHDARFLAEVNAK